MTDFLLILIALGVSFAVGAVIGSLTTLAGVKAGARAAGYDDDAAPTPPSATGDGRKL